MNRNGPHPCERVNLGLEGEPLSLPRLSLPRARRARALAPLRISRAQLLARARPPLLRIGVNQRRKSTLLVELQRTQKRGKRVRGGELMMGRDDECVRDNHAPDGS